MGTSTVCLAALILLLSSFTHAETCSSGGSLIIVSSGFTVCGWTVPLPNQLDTVVCDDGFLLAVRDYTTQRVFGLYGTLKGFNKDLWIGATVTPNGTTVDTNGQSLPYTNFDDGYPFNPAMKTCVVLNKKWGFKWRNRHITTGGEIYALCTDVEIRPLSTTSPVSNVTSNLSPDSTVTDASLTKNDTIEPGLDTTEANKGRYGLNTTKVFGLDTTEANKGQHGLNTTKVFGLDTTEANKGRYGLNTTTEPGLDTTEANKGRYGLNTTGARSSDITTTVDNSVTNTHISDVTDLPISTSPSSAMSSDFVSSASLTNTKSSTAVTSQRPRSSSLSTPRTTLSFGAYANTSIESTYGPLPVTAPNLPTCNYSTRNGPDNCCCVCAPNKKNITNLVELLDNLRQILTVDKASLSSTYRQKHSAEDNRNTSVYMGCVAIVVLVVVIIIVVFLDVSHFLFR